MLLPDPLKQLESMVGALLAEESAPSPERIRELIDSIRRIPKMFDSLDDDACEILAREFEERHGVTMTIGPVLTDDSYEPWPWPPDESKARAVRRRSRIALRTAGVLMQARWATAAGVRSVVAMSIPPSGLGSLLVRVQ